jgi:methionyl-tRNA formyltransferase
MRLVFMGTPEFAIPSLRALLRASHQIAFVVTRPDRSRRRPGSIPKPSPVKAEAVRLDLPVIEPETLRDPAFMERLRESGAEAIIVVAFGRLLPPAVLEAPSRGCINVHGSILPRWRGAAPVERAIIAGDSRTGVSTMLMDRGLDTGDVLMTRASDIGPLETAGELGDRLAMSGADLLLETLAGVERRALRPQPQDPALATLAPPLRREDAAIAWDAEAGSIAARVRGCNPWPVVSVGLNGRRVQLLRATEIRGLSGVRAGESAREPGAVIEAAQDRLVIACGGGTALGILELRFPDRNKRAIGPREAIIGRLVRPGDRLTSPPP